MVAISRNKTAIAIVNAGVHASALQATDFIFGQIKSYSKSGGEQDVESDPHFGGFVDIEKARTLVQLQFGITPDLEEPNRWNALAYKEDSTSAGTYTMRGDLTDKAVYLGHSDGTRLQAYGFNNCNVTVLDLDHNADANQTATLTLKFSPTNRAGVSNFMTKSSTGSNRTPEVVPALVLPNWTSLDGN